MTVYNTPNKYKSREDTIISIFRNETGLKSVPKDRQVFTLCNYSWDTDKSKVMQGSDYDQLVVKNKLCTPEQYHGVDFDNDCIETNKNIKESHWHNTTMGKAMKTLQAEPWFNPQVIYYDTMGMPETTIDEFFTILYILKMNKIKNCIIVFNFVLERPPYHFRTVKDFVTGMNNHKRSRLLKNVIHSDAYHYHKVNANKTEMCTVVFKTI